MKKLEKLLESEGFILLSTVFQGVKKDFTQSLFWESFKKYTLNLRNRKTILPYFNSPTSFNNTYRVLSKWMLLLSFLQLALFASLLIVFILIMVKEDGSLSPIFVFDKEKLVFIKEERQMKNLIYYFTSISFDFFISECILLSFMLIFKPLIKANKWNFIFIICSFCWFSSTFCFLFFFNHLKYSLFLTKIFNFSLFRVIFFLSLLIYILFFTLPYIIFFFKFITGGESKDFRFTNLSSNKNLFLKIVINTIFFLIFLLFFILIILKYRLITEDKKRFILGSKISLVDCSHSPEKFGEVFEEISFIAQFLVFILIIFIVLKLVVCRKVLSISEKIHLIFFFFFVTNSYLLLMWFIQLISGSTTIILFLLSVFFLISFIIFVEERDNF